jgi:8-oxo-dGTP pyrophosphatase MutT (NUDIX family)
MYIKIFFGFKELYLCDSIDEHIEPILHHDDAVFIDELNAQTIRSMIHEMEQPAVHAGVFYHPDFNALKKSFFKKFTFVQAAGGLVQNEKGQVLFIFRRGKWDLPKGKTGKKESIPDCAIREVKEETGLKKLKLVAPLSATYHTYHEGARFNLKETWWYSMKAGSTEKLVPQLEEDIHEIEWVDQADIAVYVKRSYPLVGDVIKGISL